jgi:ectoine hydroxylase-related dioxygenase (phytanoyl-CoA dioxygenase family)
MTAQFRPAPAPPTITASHVRRFRRDGFLHVTGGLTRDAVAQVRMAAAKLFGDDGEDRDTRKVLTPSRLDPEIHAAATAEALESVAQALARSRCRRFFDQLVYKPSRQARGTRWHQDFAYSATPSARAGSVPPQRHLHVWIALDAFDPDSGCIHFAPRRHDRLLPHVVARGDPQGDRVLEIEPTIAAGLQREAAPVAVLPGDLTIHHDGTPHCNPPNTSDVGRMFLVVSWERLDV